MSRRVKHSKEVEDTLRALRRGAKRALELGLQMGTPVYVWKDGNPLLVCAKALLVRARIIAATAINLNLVTTKHSLKFVLAADERR